MKRVFSLFLVFALISSVCVFAYAADDAEIIEFEFEPTFTNLVNEQNSSYKDWIKNDSNRAVLGILLLADVFNANPDLKDMFDLTNLYDNAFLIREGVGVKNVSYSIFIYFQKNVLFINYKPDTGEGVYFVSEGIEKSLFEGFIEQYNYWKFDEDSIDEIIDLFAD